MSETRPSRSSLTRRTFLKGSVAAGAAVAGGGLWTTAIHAKPTRAADTPIEHIVVAVQENRSFDHYYGMDPRVRAAGFGVPDGWTNPDGRGGTVAPYHLTALQTPDIGHEWVDAHAQVDGGAMDGFYTDAGPISMGYYTAAELPFYYSLFETSTLAAGFHCSVLGPTWPNRFYVMAGTSGGITTNGIWGYGVFDYPMILDLLDAAGVTWKVYNLGWDSVPYGNTDNVAVFWKKYAHDMRTRGSKGSYLNDLRQNRLPQVSFLIPSYARGWDEHPPASPQVGMALQEECVNALRDSSAWASSAYIITYDEHGGFFDHVAPPGMKYKAPVGNTWVDPSPFNTLGVRVPGIVVSPLVEAGSAFHGMLDHTAILQLIVDRFGDAQDLAFFGDAVARKANRVQSLAQLITRTAPRADVLALPDAPQVFAGAATTPALTGIARIFRTVMASKPKLAA